MTKVNGAARGILVVLSLVWSLSAAPQTVNASARAAFIDKMVRVDLRTVTLNIPPQEVITRDNVPASVNAVCYFRVVDASASMGVPARDDKLGVAREDVALAEFGDADAKTFRATRFVLHGLRDLREELVAHRARLGPRRRVIPAGRLGVRVDAGDDDEALRTSVGWQSGECIDDRVDRVAAAAGDRLLPAAGPAQRSDPCPCDADH